MVFPTFSICAFIFSALILILGLGSFAGAVGFCRAEEQATKKRVKNDKQNVRILNILF
jgi:hypothetical protein